MDQLPLTLPNPPTSRRRGRPPGARSKRSLELGKYIEARFAGMTPGQQLAELSMVTARQVREAGGVQAAMAAKAKELGRELAIDAASAMAILVKGLTELMPYVHQRQAQAPAAKDPGAIPTVFLVPDGAPPPALADFSDADPDAIDFPQVFEGEAREVGSPKSDDQP